MCQTRRSSKRLDRIAGGKPRRTFPECGLAVLVAAVLAACAPIRQSALGPTDFARARFEADRFVSFDGARLGLSVWRPQGVEPWAVIVGLHGMNDYANTYHLAGPWWAQRGVATYAIDLRGFGRSPNRGVWPDPELTTQDVRAALAVARARHPDAVLALVGVSMGAANAALAAQAAPEAMDRLVLVSPAVWGWRRLPWTYAATLRVAAWTAPGFSLKPPKRVTRQVTPSDNVAMLIRNGRDPNMLFETRVDAVYGLINLMQAGAEAMRDAPPDTLFLMGERDEIIPAPALEAAAAELPAEARVLRYPEGYHMLLRDLQAETVWRDVLVYLADPAAPSPSQAEEAAPAELVNAR